MTPASERKNPKRLPVALLALSLALLAIACTFNENAQTPEGQGQAQSATQEQPSGTPARGQTRTAAGEETSPQTAAPTPPPSAAGAGTTGIQREYRERCRFWAMENLSPILYAEFTKLNPEEMSDLERILWSRHLSSAGSLHYDIDTTNEYAPMEPRLPDLYCQDYYSEPVNSRNSLLRNEMYEHACRAQLHQKALERYGLLAEYRDRGYYSQAGYSIPNHYVMILKWLDDPEPEVPETGQPPYALFRELGGRPYAHMTLGSYAGMTPEEFGILPGDSGKPDPEWAGIILSAGLSDNGQDALDICRAYYPQLFYGRWIPYDEQYSSSYQATNSSREETIRHDPETMPIYLPRKTSQQIVMEGYPIGESRETYLFCQSYSSSELERAGYYYVQHPKGNYCEKFMPE